MGERIGNECAVCHRPIDLPFVAHTPKRCGECERHPTHTRRMPARRMPLAMRDADANGVWANVVTAYEEDR